MAGMSERAAFLAAILAEPDDDTPRLVFCDWLNDHGLEPEREKFIRVQVKLEQPDPEPLPRCTFHSERMAKVGRPYDDETYDKHDRWCNWCRWSHGEDTSERVALRLRERELFAQSETTHSWFGPALQVTILGSDWYE